MESEDLHLPDDSLSTEQDHKVAKGETEMDVAPTYQWELVPEEMVEEVSLQEKVTETGNKNTTEVEEEIAKEYEYEDLDRYLDTLMLDMTMSIAREKKIYTTGFHNSLSKWRS